jgi:hypothetical protein
MFVGLQGMRAWDVNAQTCVRSYFHYRLRSLEYVEHVRRFICIQQITASAATPVKTLA